MALLQSLAERVNPEVAALLVVDPQNDFCSPAGALARRSSISMKQERLPHMKRLTDAARPAGVPVVMVRLIHSPHTDPPNHLLQRGVQPPYCVEGTWGAEFCPGFEPQPGDLVVTKHRYSAFIGTNLDLLLRAMARESVIIIGGGTNVCVESTLRDAFMLGYYVVIPEDCVATSDSHWHLHEATLENVRLCFGEVVSSEQIIELWVGR